MPERVRKPEWLKISIGANERYTETKRIVESHCLHTRSEEHTSELQSR